MLPSAKLSWQLGITVLFSPKQAVMMNNDQIEWALKIQYFGSAPPGGGRSETGNTTIFFLGPTISPDQYSFG